MNQDFSFQHTLVILNILIFDGGTLEAECADHDNEDDCTAKIFPNYDGWQPPSPTDCACYDIP